MKPSSGATRAAKRVMSQYHIDCRRLRLITGVNTTDTEILHGIATIIEEETHCGEMKEALKNLCDEIMNGRKFNIRKDFSLLNAEASARTVLDKVK